MDGFHLLTDFDGVWTDPEREAREVDATVVRELGRISGLARDEVAGIVERCQETILRAPDRHGWRIDGRFTSYVDEDYFALPTAVGQALEEAEDPVARRAAEAVLAEFESVSVFLDHCYYSTCERFRQEVHHDLARGAERVLEWLVAGGCRVTFVTNAPATKVVDWFGHHGILVVDAREENGGHPLRVYGRAGKQWLGDSGEVLEFAGRRIQADRPQYRAILEREAPDMVVGDVVSIDLAQPLSMRARNQPGAPRSVVLLCRKEAPEWVREAAGPEPHRIDSFIAHVTELPRLVLQARSALRLQRA